MAQENKFRFSSEYMDDELGLIYYNYRHLNPLDGRWISRDPIMEQGGWNLYSYIYNSPTISNDIIGLYTVSYEVNLGVIGAPFYAKIQGEIQTNPYFKVSGEFYAAWQWTIPGVKKIDKLASKYLGIHFDAGIRVGTKAKISYSGCKKLSNIKVCGSAEAFSVIEYRRRGYRNKSTGRFNRQRFGINASGSGDLCLNLCNGDISLQANISWSAYVNIGVLGFNKTISGGGNYSFPEKNLVTIPSLAILKKYCNS
ncbi:MAG TPA: RHS repeat-associated core domain-containing protein [Akkermansia muciniphila]|nr:RHS repeat-associated core domain-containing protein [Akkermansia muciniphila]